MSFKLLFCIIGLYSLCLSENSFSQTLFTGFRASRILNSYPNKKFPSSDYWVNTGKIIAGKFNNATPAAVWIVSLYWGDGVTGIDFPSGGKSYPYMEFLNTDYSETYLTRFDNEGFKIWLQVEPGAANIDTLIELVLKRYKHHPCVIGFGIDVEWLDANTNPNGRKVTDAEAERWEKRVKAINPEYSLFLKHYSSSYLPPNYRGKILFVDDSQQFTSLNSMVNEFKAWGSKFSPSPVAFQYGYPIDKAWWSALADPMSDIGKALLGKIPNIQGLFWVDFTLNQVFPTAVKESKNEVTNPSKLNFSGNYPNPFNSKTNIEFIIEEPGFVKLIIYDILGNKIDILLDEYLISNKYSVTWNTKNINTGIYFYKLFYKNECEIHKMVYLK